MKTVTVVFSRDSQLVAAFTAQKTLAWPATGGTTAASISTADEGMLKLVLPFFKKWKWRGPACVEFKTDSRTGQDKLIEINPRFPGYLRFPCECGLDLSAMVTTAAAPGEFPPLVFPGYRVGAEYANPLLVLESYLSSLRPGNTRSRECRAGVREVMKALPAACHMLRDPLPHLGKVWGRFQRKAESTPFLVGRDSEGVGGR